MSEDRSAEDPTPPKKKFSLVRVIVMLVVIFGIGGAFLIYLNAQAMLDSYAPRNLNDVFSACEAYWAKNGPDKDCNAEALSQSGIRLILRSGVSLQYSGNRENFEGTAQHRSSNRVYTIDAKGRTKRK